MKKSLHFRLEELVPPEVFKRDGEKAWGLLTEELIDSIDGVHDVLHEVFDTPETKIKITINDWLWGGQYHESGYRVPETTTGAEKSQHKKGNGADIKVKGVPAAKVQQAILDHEDDPRLAKITRMESNPPTSGWTHIDCKILLPGQARIRVFQP